VLNSDGSAWRPNVHVQDIAQAVRRTVDSDWNGGELLVLNVGDEANNTRIIDIAKLIAAQVPGCEIKFLSENKDLDKEGFIKDRNVNVTDTRNYQVSFEKIKKQFPGFACAWPVERGVADMLAKFKEMPLTKAEFKNPNYYRLKKLGSLYANHRLSRELRWI
jgi:nucleoside-diphosphate-sugar epimerase